MEFDLHIKNIGKLTDARLRIGRFTVFAGPNNTGKSYVSKILYSMFDAMNANHAEVYIDDLSDLWDMSCEVSGRSEEAEALLAELSPEIKALQDQVMKFPVGLDNPMSDFATRMKKVRALFLEFYSTMESSDANKDADPFALVGVGDIKRSLVRLGFLSEYPGQNESVDMDAKKVIASLTGDRIREKLIQNFQVADPANLRGTEDAPSRIDIKNFCTFDFSKREMEFGMDRAWLLGGKRFSNVIYLESPVYWKLKNALEDMLMNPRYRPRPGRMRLGGIPGYFYDLASALKSEYTGDMDFQGVYEKLTGKSVLGGKIIISESGDLLFQENGRRSPLSLTAMGVANLGILALLIERKVLDQRSFLFIDEPEAHLHPAWQVVMAESLFALVKGGVHVVIATHSVDILKYLEVHVQENPEDKHLVALNKFPFHEGKNNEQDFDDRLADIQQELTQPFAYLHMQSL
ncbi:MAG: AAA family ATPase [Nitrospira sp.]|nr:AAA family ATPase [Nitrospira sp.]